MVKDLNLLNTGEDIIYILLDTAILIILRLGAAISIILRCVGPRRSEHSNI